MEAVKNAGLYLAAVLLVLVLAAEAASAKSLSPYPYVVYPGDANGAEVRSFKPGDTLYFWVENLLDSPIRFSIRVDIVNPQGLVVASRSTSNIELPPRGKVPVVTWQIPQDAPEGTWTIKFLIEDSLGNRIEDSETFTVRAAAAQPAAPPAQQAQPQQQQNLILIAAIAAAVIIVVAALIAATRGGKKPAKPAEAAQQPQAPASPVPQPAQQPPPLPGTGGEPTVVAQPQQAATGGGETVVALAKLVAPDGSVIPVTSYRQEFGREDFEHLLPPDKARLISRRSRPQFVIFYDFSKGQFFIEDRNSANGTYLNGKQIRGLGPQPLKDGDKINPAGVIELTFRL